MDDVVAYSMMGVGDIPGKVIYQIYLPGQNHAGTLQFEY
jgi:hypothetical protein